MYLVDKIGLMMASGQSSKKDFEDLYDKYLSASARGCKGADPFWDVTAKEMFLLATSYGTDVVSNLNEIETSEKCPPVSIKTIRSIRATLFAEMYGVTV